MKKLYAAYGMNTNLEQMRLRCSTARSLGRAVLPGHRFEFKRHATVDADVTQDCAVVLWEIYPQDEEALDRLEGYPMYYNKKEVDVWYQGKVVTAMTYIMYDHETLYPPSQNYYDLVAEGYQTHGINVDQLNDALDRIKASYKLTNYQNECIM